MTAGQKESADGLVPIGSEHCLRKKKEKKKRINKRQVHYNLFT